MIKILIILTLHIFVVTYVIKNLYHKVPLYFCFLILHYSIPVFNLSYSFPISIQLLTSIYYVTRFPSVCAEIEACYRADLLVNFKWHNKIFAFAHCSAWLCYLTYYLKCAIIIVGTVCPKWNKEGLKWLKQLSQKC